MKFHLIAVAVAVQALSVGEEPVMLNLPHTQITPPMPYHEPRAWLGLQVAKPDATIIAHVPSLPPGIGFLVKSVDSGGPAEKAGLVEYDLIWKLNDQMLVNEAQLAVLLRLYKANEEIAIYGFRGGKPLELKLKLGEAPASARSYPGELVADAMMPTDSASPMRVVNVVEKSASFSADGSRAVVRREGEILKVRIDGLSDGILFEGDFAPGERFDRVPETWRRRIEVLVRTLDHALDGSVITRRQPRPRVIPPPQNP